MTNLFFAPGEAGFGLPPEDILDEPDNNGLDHEADTDQGAGDPLELLCQHEDGVPIPALDEARREFIDACSDFLEQQATRRRNALQCVILEYEETGDPDVFPDDDSPLWDNSESGLSVREESFWARVLGDYRPHTKTLQSFGATACDHLSEDFWHPGYGNEPDELPEDTFLASHGSVARESMDPDRLWEARHWSRRTSHHKPAHVRGYRSGRTGNGSGVGFSKNGRGSTPRPRSDAFGPIWCQSPGTPVFVRQVVVNEHLPEGHPCRVEVRDYVRPWQQA